MPYNGIKMKLVKIAISNEIEIAYDCRPGIPFPAKYEAIIFPNARKVIPGSKIFNGIIEELNSSINKYSIK